jgi:2-polyprenyl-3-methyl-5-hydroxy-6-metoxy-1,4-benzoquinol methylase
MNTLPSFQSSHTLLTTAMVILCNSWERKCMSSPIPRNYCYSHTRPTWEHSIILPPIIRALQSIPPNGSVLDIGCGNGAILAEIQHHGSWSLFGIDSSESAVSLARSQGFDIQLADATHDLVSLFEKHRFDLVISVEVIEHVYDPRGLLRQAHTLLRPHGRLLVTTPYHGYLKNLLISAIGKSDSHYNPLWDCGHIKFWSRKTLSAAMEETGFDSIQFYGAGRFPFLWKSMVVTAEAR